MALKFTDAERRWLLELGATRQHIFNWESGQMPGPKWAGKVAKVKGLTIEQLYMEHAQVDNTAATAG
jgi:DNA-binding XRE family transcriptional regulator